MINLPTDDLSANQFRLYLAATYGGAITRAMVLEALSDLVDATYEAADLAGMQEDAQCEYNTLEEANSKLGEENDTLTARIEVLEAELETATDRLDELEGNRA